MERAATLRVASTGDPQAGYAGAPQQVSDAINVVAWMAEQAGRIAGSGPRELAMSRALDAAFGYMVQYMHHVRIDRDEPRDALVKAAAGTNELTSDQLAFLRSVAKRRRDARLAVISEVSRSEDWTDALRRGTSADK